MSQCFGWCLKASFHTQMKSKCPAEGVRSRRRAIFQDWLIKISFVEVAARLIDGNFRERLRQGGSVKILNFRNFNTWRWHEKNFQGAARVFDESSLEKYCRKAIVKRCFTFFNLGNKNIQYSHGSARLLAAKVFTFIVLISAVWSGLVWFLLTTTHW